MPVHAMCELRGFILVQLLSEISVLILSTGLLCVTHLVVMELRTADLDEKHYVVLPYCISSTLQSQHKMFTQPTPVISNILPKARV